MCIGIYIFDFKKQTNKERRKRRIQKMQKKKKQKKLKKKNWLQFLKKNILDKLLTN